MYENLKKPLSEKWLATRRQSGLKSAETCKKLYGDDFYNLIGAKGGKESGKYKGRGGFAKSGLAREAGAKGGAARRRNAR